MKEIGSATLAGQLDGEDLGQMTHLGRSQRLTAIWGVGQWTADMMGIFYFGDADIWPDGDSAARKQLAMLANADESTIDIATHFAPYRSYLALYMWRQTKTKPT